MHKMVLRNKTGFKVVRVTKRYAMRNFCLECSGWEESAAADCDGKMIDGTVCRVYPYKRRQQKQNAKERDSAIKAECRHCINSSVIGDKCQSQFCALYPYRDYRIDRSVLYSADMQDTEILKVRFGD